MPRILLLVLVIAVILLTIESYIRKVRKKRSFSSGMSGDTTYDELLYNYQLAIKSENTNAIERAGTALLEYPKTDTLDLEMIYTDALELLSENPDLKPYALQAGRQKYAADSENGLLTSYDESAIGNDILAASK
jgi:hypothetical protein